MLQILCVLKTGGDYDLSYVLRLKEAVRQHIGNVAYSFRCLSDDENVGHVCYRVPLKHYWPGWWSKVELFRDGIPKGPAIYFDLDTVIVGDLGPIVDFALFSNIPFSMLRGFNANLGDNPASGIMVAGSELGFSYYSKVYEDFVLDPDRAVQNTKEDARQRFSHYRRAGGQMGDQGWISTTIGYDRIPKLQDYLPEDFICGKKHVKAGEIPKTASIVAWSGKPRLHMQDSPLAKIWRSYA